MREVTAIPAPDDGENADAEEGQERKPHDGRLAPRDHDERGQQRPERAPGITADLKERLRKSMPSARTKMSDARRFRVKYGRTHSNKRDRHQNQRQAAGESEQDESDEREAHSDGERVRLWPTIGVETDERLQDRGGELIHQCDQADVSEVELERFLQHGINRRDQRLHRVVQQVRETEGRENRQDRGHRRWSDRILRANWWAADRCFHFVRHA